MYPLPYSVVSGSYLFCYARFGDYLLMQMYLADGLCELTVLNNSPGVPEIMAWSQLWSAAVEVAGMCVNVGYRGGIRGDMGRVFCFQ